MVDDTWSILSYHFKERSLETRESVEDLILLQLAGERS